MKQPSLDKRSLLLFLGMLVFMFSVAKVIYVTSSRPDITHQTDFLCAFYPAGYLVRTGRSADLYPPVAATSYTDSAFSKTALSLLPFAPRDVVAIWLYSPLNALLFAPFSLLSPQVALAAWQLLSLGSVGLTCFFLARATTKRSCSGVFWLSWLYAPIFQSIYMGQLSIPLGVLPLAAGYYLLTRQKDFAAGLTFAATALNPKYLPIAGAICIIRALSKQYSSLAGLVAGFIAFVALSLLLFPPGVFFAWIGSVSRAENAFYDPRLLTPFPHLIASLPAAILLTIPASWRHLGKPSVYCLSAVIGLVSFWRCWKLSRLSKDTSLVLAASLLVFSYCIPLLEPHILAYDLSALFLALFIMISHNWPETVRKELRIAAVIAWIAISANYFLYTYMAVRLHPFILIAVLVGLLIEILRSFKKMESLSPQSTAPN